MSGEVVEMECGRKRRQERQEAKERFKRRRVALGLADAPADVSGRLCVMCGKPAVMAMPLINADTDEDAGHKYFCAEHTPSWPGGIDDLEVEQ